MVLQQPWGPYHAIEHAHQAVGRQKPWNKGKLVGPTPPFKLKEIWAIRIRLQIAGRIRDLALFMVEALENDVLVREAPAIVGCQTPSALAHAGG